MASGKLVQTPGEKGRDKSLTCNCGARQAAMRSRELGSTDAFKTCLPTKTRVGLTETQAVVASPLESKVEGIFDGVQSTARGLLEFS